MKTTKPASLTATRLVLPLAMMAAALALPGCAGAPAPATSGDSAPAVTDGFEGAWEGTLKAGSAEVRLIFIVTDSGVTMDVPAQGVRGMVASSVEKGGSGLVAEFAGLKASLDMKPADEQTIEAIWSQGGGVFPLTLRRSGTAAEADDGSGERVRFPSAAPGVEMAGTLTLPEGAGPFPCLVLITGSGAQDRDEALLGMKPFRDIALALAKKGWATLRYDDRGVGESSGSFAGSTSFDFSRDAVGAYRFAASHARIDPKRVALGGHSEGGYVAALAENELGGVYGLLLIAAPGVRGYDIVLDQNADILASMGAPEAAIAAAGAINRRIYDLILGSDEVPVAAIEAELRKAGVPDDQVAAQMAALSDPWYKAFLASDPAVPLSRVRSPVLAMNGSKDTQVRADKNLAAIGAAARAAGVPFASLKLDGLNHLFQKAVTGSPAEYASLEMEFSAEAIAAMASWLESLPR